MKDYSSKIMQRYEIRGRQTGTIGVLRYMVKFRFALIGLLLLAGAGCSSTTNSVVSQMVDEIAWLPNESGLLATMEKTTISSLDGSTIYGENLYNVGTDGSIGNSINPVDYAPNSTTGYTSLLFVSPDGHTAYTPFGTDIYRVDLPSGNLTDLFSNTNLLGVSPDAKYVLTTVTSAQYSTRILLAYNVLPAQPVRLPEQTALGVVSTRALWIDGGHFALTTYDSTGSDNVPWDHVTIYDTSGHITQIIPNASVQLHASAYSPKSGDLFVETHALGIDKFNLKTDTRTSVITNDSVESMDASSDGTLLVYCSGESTQQYQGYAVNVANGHKTAIASGMIAPFISPNADRVAFIHQLSGGSNSDIQVIPVSLPN